MTRMRQALSAAISAAILVAILAAFLAAAGPAAAETERDAPLSGETIERELEALSAEAEQALRRFLTLVEPFARRLAESLSDLPRYGAPEILPNGDILIRRLPAPTPAPKEGEEDVDQTEL